MAEPLFKKRKFNNDDEKSSGQAAVRDVRFANTQRDPRYQLPSKRHANVKVDKRFAHMLRDEDFTRKAKVDRYGRPLEDNAERRRLRQRYNFDDDVEEDDNVVRRELRRVDSKLDPIRDGGYSQSSSSDDSSTGDDESEEEEEEKIDYGVDPSKSQEIPMGTISSRIAVVNLDWDNIRAADLLAVFSSFLPPGGRLTRVAIYPSQFGRERMAREETEGPPREVFSSNRVQAASRDSDRESEDSENIKDTILQNDAGEEFDPAALRKYQVQRLQYFYAILGFSSNEVARSVYDQVDGAEFLTTANFFDLRFVPEETTFEEDQVHDTCERLPSDYKPNEFATDALQHSKVKLTWDAEDISRKTAQAKAFRGGRKDLDENDLKAYLGSGSSSEEETTTKEEHTTDKNMSKKVQERQQTRALLGLQTEPKKGAKTEDKAVGHLQITFSSGLLGDNAAKTPIFKNEPEVEETTVEKYKRKEQERRQKRKDRFQSSHEGFVKDGSMTDQDEETGQVEPAQDLGFDDPFFGDSDPPKASAAKLRKEKRLKKRREREAEEAAAEAKRAELELLMVDDRNAGDEVHHFDMREIERSEKQAKKSKGKKGGKTPKAHAISAQQQDFKIDTHDPRFSRLYENHEFAIDPTNPKFKGTTGMKALLEEGRRQKKERNRNQPKDKRRVPQADRTLTSNQPSQNGSDVQKLVAKLKKQ